MRDRVPDPNIWLVYSAIFLLGIAYGISIAVTALFLDARGYSKNDIGSLAAWFALGIVVMSIPAGTLVRRLSGRTVLAASLLGYAASVAAFPYAGSYPAIAAVRFLDGVFSVGIWVSCETILLVRAGEQHKAFVTSLYAISMAVGYVLGPLLARLIAAVAPLRAAFTTSALIATASALLVIWRLEREPPHEAQAEAAARANGPRPSLLWRIKTSCFATFAYGYFQASVVLFLPLYLMESKGIARERTIVIPAFFAVGMLLASNWAGRLGDRHGHLRVMRVLGVVGTLMILGFVYLEAYAAMCVAVFVAGASLASISPVSLALQGVIVERDEYSRANGLYNAVYASGMLLGPPLSSRIYGAGSGEAMLFHLAGLWAAFVLFSLVFAHDDPAARRPLVARVAR